MRVNIWQSAELPTNGGVGWPWKSDRVRSSQEIRSGNGGNV